MPLPASTSSLAALRKAIKDALVAALQAATAAGEGLEDVQDVVSARSGDVGLELPAVWVDAQPHEPDLRGGHTAQHGFMFDVWAMVENYNDAEEGEEEADDLMARAYDVVLADRTLSGTVHDVRPAMVDVPVGSAEKDGVYLSRFRIECRIDRRE